MVNCGLENIKWNIPEIIHKFINSKLHTILSNIMKSCATHPHPAQDMNHPLSSLSHLLAAQQPPAYQITCHSTFVLQKPLILFSNGPKSQSSKAWQVDSLYCANYKLNLSQVCQVCRYHRYVCILGIQRVWHYLQFQALGCRGNVCPLPKGRLLYMENNTGT